MRNPEPQFLTSKLWSYLKRDIPLVESGGRNERGGGFKTSIPPMALKGPANSVNPDSKDYLRWDGGQPLVDASFVALALVRCPWL